MLQKFVLILLGFIYFSSSAIAQERVIVRAADHSEYSRIVFDWANAASYKVNKNAGGDVFITFNRSAFLDFPGLDYNEVTGVNGIRQEAAGSNELKVSIDVAGDRKYRHFSLGNRVVVDIYKKNGDKNISASKKAPAKKRASAKQVSKKSNEAMPKVRSAPVSEVTSAPLPPEEGLVSANSDQSVKPGKKVKEENLIEASANDFEAHIITLSLTESVGLAAFIRSDALWIVLDKANITAMPLVAGPMKKLFPSFKRYELTGGTAYRVVLPSEMKGSYIYGEGGGLVWRIVLSPNEREDESIKPEHSFLNAVNSRGGTVLWPLKFTSRILDLYDPTVGDTLKVVMVERSDQFSGAVRSYVDFNALRSPIGLTLSPKVDDLLISLRVDGVQISRPNGLAVSRDKDINIRLMRENVSEIDMAALTDGASGMRRIFDFDRWMMGGVRALKDNQHILLSNIGKKDKAGRVQDLLTLAKMNVANDRGQEALGFLEVALDEMPDIEKGAEFLALRGAANALSDKHELAFKDLADPSLSSYGELNYWRSYTLAWLEDWQQARQRLPESFELLVGYPRPLLEKLGLKLAEVALRGGDVNTAETVLSVLRKEEDNLALWTTSGMDYLAGEAARQSEDYGQAKELWQKLSKGKDDWYRTRAGLALTLLEVERGDISNDAAIDRLEGLRYSWRGDELEAQINYTLGKLYIEEGSYLKGLTILRDSASMSPRSDIGKEVASFMSTKFSDLLLYDEKLSALDAVTIFEEFRELTPTGDLGNKMVQKLAERLVDADLLDRAAKILQHQVDFRIKDEEQASVAMRLATVYILDRRPVEAMKALKVAYDFYKPKSDSTSKAKLYDIELLRARALSDNDQTEQAIALLNGFKPTPDVNRLRADIAWQAGLWEDASEALNDLIIDEELDLSRKLSPKQADIILHRSIALNLSGDRVELSNVRKRYGESMKQTSRARLFDVITRPRKNSLLSDRETLTALVDEVDIFKDFLESYRKSDKISN
jgi:hypothetical protein